MSANPFEWFYKIFGKHENQAIQNLYDTVGPKNPFVGLPQLTEAQLEPGDIIATTSTAHSRKRPGSPHGRDSAMSPSTWVTA